MPRKQQGWVTFQSSEEERQILEQVCQQSQRSKTEILRELVRSLNQPQPRVEKTIYREDANHSQQVSSLQQSPEKAMKMSARNVLKGTVKRVVTGVVNTEVTLEVAPGIAITSVITKASAEQLGLAEGKQAYAVIKSSNVMVAVD